MTRNQFPFRGETQVQEPQAQENIPQSPYANKKPGQSAGVSVHMSSPSKPVLKQPPVPGAPAMQQQSAQNPPVKAGSNVAVASNELMNPKDSLASKENLATIVDAVGQVKEGILKDLSRLLDDKLAGLDEVVVELIRCKSENDTLKQRLKGALDEIDALHSELSKFKPAQFGFYRKVSR